jgi:uncharacterized delta-60 repeat protein
MTLSNRMAAVAAAACLFLLAASAANAAPGDRDRSFADHGRLRIAPLGAAYKFEAALDFAAGPEGETYVLRRGVTCQEAGCGADLLVTRYRFDGSLDTSFGQGGTAKAIATQAYRSGTLAVDAEGRPLVAMAEGRIVVVRLARDGSVDHTFATQTSEFCGCLSSTAEVRTVADGDLVVYGRAEEWFGPNGPPQDRRGWAVFLVARFSADGQPDSGYGDGGQALVAVRGEVNTVTVRDDGGLLLGGSDENQPLVRRVGTDGRLDASFGTGLAKALANRGVTRGGVFPIVARSNGTALAFVMEFSVELGFRSHVIALDGEGRLVPRFGRNGLKRVPIPVVRAVQDPQGRIFVQGMAFEGKSAVMRLRPNGSPDLTFAGGRPIVMNTESAVVAMGRGSRPMLFDLGNRSFRSYSPPKPVVLRLRGGASKVRCAGRRATIVGTRRGETLQGTQGPDVIAALGGGDQVFGLGGADVICGGPAHDGLHGGPGRDNLYQ